MLTARIGRLNRAQKWRGVIAVDFIQEQEPRITVEPSRFDHLIKQLCRVHLSDHLTGAWIAQAKKFAVFQRGEELIGDAHGQVKIFQLAESVFAVNESLNVGVINAKNRHIGSSPTSTSANDGRGVIEELHEGKRSGRYSTGRVDVILTGPKRAEGKTRSTPGLVNSSHAAQRCKDRVEVIVHGQHKTSGQLPIRESGIHEGGRIGEELQFFQPLKKTILPKSCVLPKAPRRFRNRRHHSFEHGSGIFHELPSLVPSQVTLSQDRQRIVRKPRHGFTPSLLLPQPSSNPCPGHPQQFRIFRPMVLRLSLIGFFEQTTNALGKSLVGCFDQDLPAFFRDGNNTLQRV